MHLNRNMGLVTAPMLYRGVTPPLALHNHASITPSGGGRTSSAHRVDLSGGAMVLVLEAANHVRSSIHRDPTSGLYLPGVLLEPQRINSCKRSEALATAPWIARGAAGAANNTGETTDPAGGNNASKVTNVGNFPANDLYQQLAGLGNTKPYSVSGWIKRISTTGTLTIRSPLGGSATVDLSAIGAGWVYLPEVWTLGVAFTSDAAGGGFIQFADTTDTGIDFYAYGFQAEDDTLFPSSYIVTAAGAVTRTADSALVQTLGSEMARGEWTLLVPVAVPTHTPAADTKLLSIYKNGAAATDHVSLWADTSKQVKLTSAASGKAAGSVVVTSSDCCDEEVHWVSIHAKDGQLHCFVQSNDGQFHAADMDAGIALDLDRLSIEPSGGWVGGVYMQPRFRRHMPRPVQQQLLAA